MNQQLNYFNNSCIIPTDALNMTYLNRYRRKRRKMDASSFDSALSHTRRLGPVGKKEKNSVSTFGRFRLWTSLDFSPVSGKISKFQIIEY